MSALDLADLAQGAVMVAARGSKVLGFTASMAAAAVERKVGGGLNSLHGRSKSVA